MVVLDGRDTLLLPRPAPALALLHSLHLHLPADRLVLPHVHPGHGHHHLHLDPHHPPRPAGVVGREAGAQTGVDHHLVREHLGQGWHLLLVWEDLTCKTSAESEVLRSVLGGRDGDRRSISDNLWMGGNHLN